MDLMFTFSMKFFQVILNELNKLENIKKFNKSRYCLGKFLMFSLKTLVSYFKF